MKAQSGNLAQFHNGATEMQTVKELIEKRSAALARAKAAHAADNAADFEAAMAEVRAIDGQISLDGTWRAENAAIAESDPVFDQVTLTARTWAVRFNVSRELLEDGLNTDQALRAIAAGAGAKDGGAIVGRGGAIVPKALAVGMIDLLRMSRLTSDAVGTKH